VEVGASEVDLTPFEINGLGNAEAVPRHQQDQRAIAVTVTTVFGGLNQPREFGLGEILAAIAAPHCPVPPLTFHKSPFGDVRPGFVAHDQFAPINRFSHDTLCCSNPHMAHQWPDLSPTEWLPSPRDHHPSRRNRKLARHQTTVVPLQRARQFRH
jgi:hypothetical protein